MIQARGLLIRYFFYFMFLTNKSEVMKSSTLRGQDQYELLLTQNYKQKALKCYIYQVYM
jgi:hypothetical protein